MRLLIITNLFGFPWDPTRGMFNQQQFDRLAKCVDVSVLVAVPWIDVLRRPAAYWRARQEARRRQPYVDYFVFWYLPGMARCAHSASFLLSLLMQRGHFLLAKRWDCLLASWAFPDAVATSVISKLTGAPLLIKVHGTDINDYAQDPGKRWQILAAIKRSKGVIAVSQALCERLKSLGVPAEKVHVIYNGVDAAVFQPRDRHGARARLRIADQERLVLFVGNLKIAKGCLDLLHAFSKLAARDPSLTLVLAGDGPARPHIERTVQALGLTSRVRLIGKVKHSDLALWFAAAELLCLPSHNEGVPNVVLEAMSCGTPVVATRTGGIPEVLPPSAGVMVPPRDVAALADALEGALARAWPADPIVKHARQFNWDLNIQRVLSLLPTITASPEDTACSTLQ